MDIFVSPKPAVCRCCVLWVGFCNLATLTTWMEFDAWTLLLPALTLLLVNANAALPSARTPTGEVPKVHFKLFFIADLKNSKLPVTR